MKRTFQTMAALLLSVGFASAEPAPDKSIDRAAAEIVAGKIGSIRGGHTGSGELVLENTVKPRMVRKGLVPSSEIRSVWKHGLAPAIPWPRSGRDRI